MRRRGQGDIVLVHCLVGITAIGDWATQRRAVKAFRAYGTGLRQRVRGDGITLSIVAPGGFALYAAAHVPQLRLGSLGADAIAEAVVRVWRRQRPRLALPGGMTVASRLCLVWPSLLAETLWPRTEPADAAPLAGKSALGD
jgi:short-subunit dehydrogenase